MSTDWMYKIKRRNVVQSVKAWPPIFVTRGRFDGKTTPEE